MTYKALPHWLGCETSEILHYVICVLDVQNEHVYTSFVCSFSNKCTSKNVPYYVLESCGNEVYSYLILAKMYIKHQKVRNILYNM